MREPLQGQTHIGMFSLVSYRSFLPLHFLSLIFTDVGVLAVPTSYTTQGSSVLSQR